MSEIEKYVKNLESVVEQVLKPLKNIPFNIAIKAVSGFEVEFFDNKNKNHLKALEKIIEVGNIIIKESEILTAKRINEIGNKIEIIVKKAFAKINIESFTPNSKSAGYPDIEFKLDDANYYFECKTYNEKSINSSFRSFYFSPSSNFKIKQKTVHFLISFEIEAFKNGYICKSFKVVSLDTLTLDLKSEFNSSNAKIYSNNFGAKILYESDKGN